MNTTAQHQKYFKTKFETIQLRFRLHQPNSADSQWFRRKDKQGSKTGDEISRDWPGFIDSVSSRETSFLDIEVKIKLGTLD